MGTQARREERIQNACLRININNCVNGYILAGTVRNCSRSDNTIIDQPKFPKLRRFTEASIIPPNFILFVTRS